MVSHQFLLEYLMIYVVIGILILVCQMVIFYLRQKITLSILFGDFVSDHFSEGIY